MEPAVVAEVAEDTSQEDNKIGGHEATYFSIQYSAFILVSGKHVGRVEQLV